MDGIESAIRIFQSVAGLVSIRIVSICFNRDGCTATSLHYNIYRPQLLMLLSILSHAIRYVQGLNSTRNGIATNNGMVITHSIADIKPAPNIPIPTNTPSISTTAIDADYLHDIHGHQSNDYHESREGYSQCTLDPLRQ